MVTESNPYATPRASLHGAGVTDEELTAFLGENGAYYLRKWAGLRAGGTLAGFNWVAAIFTIPWLAYRRLYAYIVPAWLLPVVVAFALGLMARSIPMVFAFQVVLVAAFIVGYGLAANLLLYRRASQVLADTGGDLSAVARRGGVSEVALWIALVGTALIQGAAYLLPMLAQPK